MLDGWNKHEPLPLGTNLKDKSEKDINLSRLSSNKLQTLWVSAALSLVDGPPFEYGTI